MHVVLDSNIYLHYQSFEEIPWSKELGCEEVIIVIPAIVLEEIDKKKDEEKGKIQKRAKKVASRLGEILVDGKDGKYPVQFIESANFTEEEKKRYHLDKNDNQILFDVTRSGIDIQDVIIVSSDNPMLIRAKNCGFTIHRIDNKYRLQDELSKEEKEAKAAIAELERMKNRLPSPMLVFDNGKDHIQIKRIKALDREVEVQRRLMDLHRQWPEKSIKDEQTIMRGYTVNIVSEEQIRQYNISRNKFIEKSENKIKLEVARDDLQLRMKRVDVLIVNRGNAATGKMNIFIEIPDGVRIYRKNSKKKEEYEEPVTPSYYPGLRPTLFGFTTPGVEMWDMVDYIKDGELSKEHDSLNHKLQEGIFTFYVDSANSKNFKLNWCIIDAELPDAVKGALNVCFEEIEGGGDS